MINTLDATVKYGNKIENLQGKIKIMANTIIEKTEEKKIGATSKYNCD